MFEVKKHSKEDICQHSIVHFNWVLELTKSHSKTVGLLPEMGV
jgi:hypothetical protein